MQQDKVGIIFMVLGVILIIGSFFFLFFGYVADTIGVENYTEEENEYWGTVFTTCCAVPFLIFGLIFIGSGYYINHKSKTMDDVTKILKAYRKIKISEVALKINKPELETEELIVKSINGERVDGYIDNKTREFIYGAPISESAGDAPKSSTKRLKKKQPKKVVKKPSTALNDYNDCKLCGRPMLYDQLNKRYFCPDCEGK